MIEHTDYHKFLLDFGFAEGFLRSLSENQADYREFAYFGLEPAVFIAPSPIEGMGLFTRGRVAQGVVIAPARVGVMRTPAGRYVNHSPNPNCLFKSDGHDGLLLVAACEIFQGEELTLDYRQALAVNVEVEKEVGAVLAAGVHNSFQRLITRLTGSAIFPSTTKEEIRKKICQIEASMEGAVVDGALVNMAEDYPIRSRFAKGMYIREIQIPAGQFVIGRLHREDHYNVITKGKVSVLTEDGGLEVFTAPFSMISPAGCKRVLFTHEDTEWTTTHVTELTDVDSIEAAVIAPSYTALGWYDPKLELGFSGELQWSNSPELSFKELLCHSQL